MLPKIPRWQQYLLLAGALLAIVTSLSLRVTGHPLLQSYTPLCLPLLLWWPRPKGPFMRLYWGLMVLFLVAAELGLLLVTLLHLPV